MFYMLLLTTLLAANWLVANYLSWILTEWKRPLFQFKPFSCRPCMSFWLTIITGAPLLWYFTQGGATLYVALIVSAFLNYIVINSKIQINE